MVLVFFVSKLVDYRLPANFHDLPVIFTGSVSGNIPFSPTDLLAVEEAYISL
jgi:hypothetical protein